MKRAILAVLILTAATLACSIFMGGPSYPTTPASTQTSQPLEDQLQQAVATAAGSGVVSVQINESQLTAYLAQAVAQQSDPLITEPRVVLSNGQMTVYGKAQSGVVSANISVTMQVSVDASGQPVIQVTNTDFGPFPAPAGLNEAIASFVSEALTGSLGPVATGFRLQSITIGDGVMTVTGRIK